MKMMVRKIVTKMVIATRMVVAMLYVVMAVIMALVAGGEGRVQQLVRPLRQDHQ